MRIIALLLTLSITGSDLLGQVYLEKQSRHRFAQLNLGLDVQSSFNGYSTYQTGTDGFASADLDPVIRPRFVIGGTHFWGHADFYIAIPFGAPTQEFGPATITAYSGVETAFKYYPWRIKHKALRPYIGTSLATFFFEQDNENVTGGDGTDLNRTTFPLTAGLTYNIGNHLFELGGVWNYDNEQRYWIERDLTTDIGLPPFFVNFSYRYMLETTLSAEKDWESGRTQQVVEAIDSTKGLNAWFIGAGISSAFWTGDHGYNSEFRPFMEQYSTSLLLDFCLGYYWYKPDINFSLSYRSFSGSGDAYGIGQKVSRRSIGLEATMALFDYHGFVPFVGPILSYESLSFEEGDLGINVRNVSDDMLGLGVTFGWDIRPNDLQSWVLRTNLRYYPGLQLDIPGTEETVPFRNLEFNFIQLIIYPGRMFGW
jgi:outer membrane protein W